MSGRIGAKWLLLLFAVLSCAALLVVEVHRIEATFRRSLGQSLARTFGQDVMIGGSTEVHLLPRPHVVSTGVRLGGSDGGPSLDIPTFEATQSLGSLLSGRLAFSQFRLIRPTGTLDTDALAAGAPRSALGLLAHALPGRIVIESGALFLQSIHAPLRGTLSDVTAVLDGINRNGAAILKGHGTWRGTRVDLTAQVAPFFDFVLGRESTTEVTLRSSLITGSIDGRLHAGLRGGFDGKVAVATASLPDLLRAGGLPAGPGRVVERVSFSGSGVANPDTITFSDARVALDDTAFEGSLAWQPNGGHWAWTGTFATDTLDLTAALNAVPALRDGHGRWSDVPWNVDAALMSDVDLRVSASRALLGPLSIEDAAFSVLCRDGRIEAGFSEARSLDGLIRGRAVASVADHAVDLRVDLSLSQMDLDPLAQAIGTSGMSGSASGHLVATARGTSPRGLVDALSGRGQMSVRSGALPAPLTLIDVSSLGTAAPAWLRARDTLPFDLATADLDLTGSRLRVVDGHMIEPGGAQFFTAEASLLDRSFSFAATPRADGGAVAAPTNIAGIWGPPPRVLHVSEATTGLGRPAQDREALP